MADTENAQATTPPGWLTPGWVQLTGIDSGEVDRLGKVVNRVALYIDARRVATVAKRQRVGSALLVDGSWVAVEEAPADVFAAMNKATR